MDRIRASAPGGTRIRAPARAISMQGANEALGEDDGASAVRTTGVKASPLSDALCLASRRQANRCWGAIPFRRATSDTMAPGAAASSRMRAFSSAGQRRRPVPPVITSIRRTARGGSSIGSSISSKRSKQKIVSLAHQQPLQKVGSAHRLRFAVPDGAPIATLRAALQTG